MKAPLSALRCDLLRNSYLCRVNNNSFAPQICKVHVVICLEIHTFVG